MNVYRSGDNGEHQLVGGADLPADAVPVFHAPLGDRAAAVEVYTIANVTHFVGGQIVVERAALLAAGQPPELLPRWTPCHA